MTRDYFGEDVASRYDEGSAPMFGPEVLRPTVDVLAELAGDGDALEFAVGTGRVALPLAGRGVRGAASSTQPPWLSASGTRTTPAGCK